LPAHLQSVKNGRKKQGKTRKKSVEFWLEIVEIIPSPKQYDSGIFLQSNDFALAFAFHLFVALSSTTKLNRELVIISS